MSKPIQINVAQPKDLFQIKATAFIKILNHTHRFWQIDNPKSEYAYGILMGHIDGRTRIVTDVHPLMHYSNADTVFDESFYKEWDDLNAAQLEAEQTDMCIGWYKVIDKELKFRAPDVRNQVKIQSLGPKNVAFLLDPVKLLKEDEYGFSVFKLLGDKIFHEMCDFAKIPWEIVEIGADVDKVVNTILDMIRDYHGNKPFVTELNEDKPAPLPPGDGKDEDDGNYIDVKMDPNSPYFNQF